MQLNRMRKDSIIFHVLLLVFTAVAAVNMSELIDRHVYLHKAVQFTNEDMEAFRSMDIHPDVLRVLKESSEENNEDFIALITVHMMLNSYHMPENTALIQRPEKIGGMSIIYKSDTYRALYKRYAAVFKDIIYFPVPEDVNGNTTSFTDSWDSPRTYGGNRRHEGTDIMTSNNVRGYFPIVSMTDGIVEKMGWLEKGGYRLGIRAKSGGYFYYAHLYSYLPELKVGDTVMAGDVIGFMGDSGYGKKEGTIGKFDTHLHLGIYLDETDGEMSVNPYALLKYMENKKQRFIFS